MKQIIDKFSAQSATYKKFRPVYPQEVYDEILQHVKHRNMCWDCGTGNGQVAVGLSKHFKVVHATDVSENQIAHAEKCENIIYGIERAEKTHFTDNQFDLITVAQAAHWFDVPAFNAEVRRVGKPGAIICRWGYTLVRIDDAVNTIIDDYYQNTLAQYWNVERAHIDNKYQNLPFDFEEIPIAREHKITTDWGLYEMNGFLQSWSAVQNYKKQNDDDPVAQVMEKIKSVWPAEVRKEVTFPVFMRIGVVG